MEPELTEDNKKLIESLDMPESIRTPGRTWTRYPEIDVGDVKEVEPEVKVNGKAEIYHGSDAREILGNRIMDAIKKDENQLNAYHSFLINSLVYVDVKGKTDIEITYNEDSPVFAHLVIDTGSSSTVNIREEFHGSSDIQTSFNEFYVGKNSTVNFGSLESTDTELSYSHRKAVLEKDAHINWLNSQFSGDLNRTKIETVLKGDNSSTEKTAVWYPTDQQHFDISLHTYHIGEHTRCNMDSRAVVDDKARSIYEGLQQVENHAENTKSFQDQKSLVLSNDSEADASPKLMIENPEVEASHAASAGGIPEEELHYMKSRGLSKTKARRLMVRGYFEPVMEKIRLPGLKDQIRNEVERKLRQK